MVLSGSPMARVLRVPVVPLPLGLARLDADTARYVTRVHRLRAGERFLAFDPLARLQAEAELVVSEPRSATARFGEPEAAEGVATPDVHLLQALGKGDHFESVVRDATALGATSVTALETERTVPQPGDGMKRRARWQAVALQAARQCGRGELPELLGPVSLEAALARAVESAGALCGGGNAVRLLLDPEAECRLGEALVASAPGAALWLLIGPEGGLSSEERACSTRAGFEPVALGPFVLRMELAAAVALGAVVALRARPATAPLTYM